MRQQAQHHALATFWFPDSSARELAPHSVPIPSNITATEVPFTSNILSTFSHDSYLAYYTPFEQLDGLLKSVSEIPANQQVAGYDDSFWFMQAARSNGNGSRSYRAWLSNGWTTFLNLVKV